MRIAAISLTAGWLSACAGLPSVSDQPTRDFDFFESPIPRGHVRLEYKNSSASALCLVADDWRSHPARPLLRVVGDASGTRYKYVGRIEDRTMFFIEPSFVIVRPGQTTEVTFNVEGNYAPPKDEDYRVYYSIPVTRCDALSKAIFPIPNASHPFDLLTTNDIDLWQDRLEFIKNQYTEWSKFGFFLHLEARVQK